MMVGIPFLGLALITTQLVLTSYFNNVALGAAVDAASAAALADGGEAHGTQVGLRTVQVLAPNANPQVAVFHNASSPSTWRSVVAFESPVLLLGQIQIVQSAEVIDENQ
jgi:hypothetical protein